MSLIGLRVLLISLRMCFIKFRMPLKTIVNTICGTIKAALRRLYSQMRLLYTYIMAALMLMLVSACDDGDTFSMSPDRLLSFSVDTVRIDTVFSTVPSSTRSFWVYNRSGESLRCADVRLSGGNQKGFRVNVDGTYLSPELGYKVNDVEIRKGDSIRVFVEVTTPAANAQEPVEQIDRLLFNLESGRQQEVVLSAWTWDADFVRNKVLGRDSTIAAGRPLVVYGMLTVAEGATLTIEPGAQLFFHADAGMEVQGRLVCRGTADANVTMRGDRLDRMFDYLPYDRMSGQWQGLHFAETSYDNVISYTDIHSSFHGVRADSADVGRLKVSIDHSTIHNCQGDAVALTCCKATIVNTLMSNALGNCLKVDGGDVRVNSCTMAQFYPFDAKRGSALSFSSVTHPLLSFVCDNSIITGYSSDEMMGLRPDGDDANVFEYSFANCIIRTPEVTDEAEKTHFTDVVFEDVKDNTLAFGEKHFLKVDIDMQDYDFHLAQGSAAIGVADPQTAESDDRDGNRRDDNPDAGAYEHVGQGEETTDQ